jgi:hypothetical protein
LKTKSLFFVLLLVCFAPCLINVFSQASTIELKNGFFYIDEEKFFLKGIGYEIGAYPGMLPWNHPFNREILENDLARIVDAGFNTIRTWNAFTDQELQVVQEYGLKIIMGLWIDPAGDYSDPAFVNTSLQQIEDVLSYSKNYDNIIAYLIMNEPMPDHIFDVGYSHVYSLWKQAMQLIHSLHPGRPVSMANTCVGDFIDPQIFDFSAYNIYPYNPSTVNYSYTYPAYVKSIFQQRTDDHPLVVTEYGLSVSPSGPGNWGYGGNTPEEQAAGIQYMYRSMIDGSASGSCVFNYSDGWWKAGNEFMHDDAAEEWFGLVEYTSVDDTYGIGRIAWDSVKVYNRAIIHSPKNQEIYTAHVPIELFVQDTITRFEIVIENATVMDEPIINNYYNGILTLSSGSIGAYALTFNFYNSLDQLMKKETIRLLASDSPVQLPEINIAVSPEPVQGDNTIQANFEIVNTGSLQTNYVLDYVFYNHIGWDYGTAATAYLSEGNPSHSADFSYTSDVDVISLAAGIDATFGSFTKRITAERIFLLGDTAHIEPPSGISIEESPEERLVVYPNPASDYLQVKADIKEEAISRIMDSFGSVVIEEKYTDKQSIEIQCLPRGLYFLVINCQSGNVFYSSFIKLD